MQMHQTKTGKLTAAQIRALSRKSVFRWLIDAVIDWLIIGLTFWTLALAQNLLLVIPAILILGNRQHALTVLGHEAAHFALSKSRKVNDLTGNLFAFWSLGLTVSGYRSVHLRHHKHTNTDQDPELAHRRARAPQWDLPISIPRIAKYCVYDLLGGSLADYLIIVRFAKPAGNAEYAPLVLCHAAFVAVCMLTGYWWIAALWYVALVTSFMMFFRLRTFLEHLGTPDTHRLHLNVWQRHLIAPHNIWYHWEHHNYPAIAWRNLPKARALLPEKKIISLKELLAFYRDCDAVPSGEALKQSSVAG